MQPYDRMIWTFAERAATATRRWRVRLARWTIDSVVQRHDHRGNPGCGDDARCRGAADETAEAGPGMRRHDKQTGGVRGEVRSHSRRGAQWIGLYVNANIERSICQQVAQALEGGFKII